MPSLQVDGDKFISDLSELLNKVHAQENLVSKSYCIGELGGMQIQLTVVKDSDKMLFETEKYRCITLGEDISEEK